MTSEDIPPYGKHDASYIAAGGEAGIRTLVDTFFDRMGSDLRFRPIFDMHPEDKEISRDKLARFLCGWLGGPKKFQEKYGPISIPRAHEHLPITRFEHDTWLVCMQESIEEQPFRPDFKHYLLEQLRVPAEGVRRRCEKEQARTQ